ncbi:MAG TPA: sigma 54-interacting transcriptional regulator [Candidatus Sulfotelmatobacter sp.]|nr:sigma 54-interacting transcriptional regulator [Candidatus Sulfotelmatobacter sp.]
MAAEVIDYVAGGSEQPHHLNLPFDSHRLLNAYVNDSADGLCVLDSQLRYVWVNEALAAINGYPIATHLGKSIEELLGSNVAASVEPYMRRALARNEPALNLEISALLPSRNKIGHWLCDFLPIKNQAGSVDGLAIAVVEITDLNDRLHAEMDRKQMLLDVISLVTSDWNLAQVFPRISARIRRTFRHEYASFALHDSSTGLLVCQGIDFPFGKGFVSAAHLAASDSPTAHVMRGGVPTIFTKEELRGFENDSAGSFVEEGIRSLCCLPLVRDSRPLGVFVLGSTRNDAFHTEDLHLFQQIGTQLSIAIENHRTASEIEVLRQRLGDERKILSGNWRSGGHFAEIIGESHALKQVLDQVATVAASEATVLILGETGTGKELVAREIHRMSRRKDGPFIKVNCAAIPTGLLESELFGHEKGAFTGAISQKIGRMELADGGTVLLDEIGDIALELQPKLLRVLQDQEFERLGSNHTIRVNVRLVAATNRDLAKGVAEHQFRSDLFYRLSVFPIRVPPLRERRDDIPLLVGHFVRKFALRMDRHIETIPKESMKALSEWPWPGNVRELENLIERSVILSENKALRVPLSELSSTDMNGDHTLDSAERQHILRILRETGGLLSGPGGAAHRLGLKRTTLQSKMQRLRITREEYFSSHVSPPATLKKDG